MGEVQRVSTEKCEQIRVLSRNECLCEMIIEKGGIGGHRGGNRVLKALTVVFLCYLDAIRGGLVLFWCS